MKKIYSIILVVALGILSLSVNAQISEEESGEFLNKEGNLEDIEKIIKTGSGETVPNLIFFYNPFSALTNHDRVELAKERALNAWFNQQYENFKTEIENQLQNSYPNFEQARNNYFKHWERKNLLNNAGNVKNKYDSRLDVGRGVREGSVRNLKLLELRELELNQGNINNTSFDLFDFNGMPIGNITTLSQLNTLRNQEMGVFSNNETLLYNNYGISQFLSLDIINDMGSYSNRFNFDYNILNEILQFQVNHFNSYGSWQQLDLMQLYLNQYRLPLVLINPVFVRDFGTASFLENYAIEHRRGTVSVWDDNYYDYLVELMSEGAGGDERAIEAAEDAAELQVEAERQYALDNLLEINLDFASILTQGVTTNSANPVLGADCRSFEYAQPPGALQKGCAVLNFNHTFYALRPNGSSGFTESNISEVFFTMPALMTNGRAANLTAIAVTAAIKATDIWYGLNPFATKFAVGDFFRRTIQTSMRSIGGSVSTTPPFSIPSPAPYIVSLVGPGLGCD